MREIIELVNQMSPYLLLGFLLAGIMHSFIPDNLYSKYLGRPTFRSVVNAAILGIPIPLCSCGVIPTAMSLKKEGASRGATVSFLIATPQTGVDSIIATYSLLGLPFALIRPVAALVTSLFGGEMVNLLDKEKEGSGTRSATTPQTRRSLKEKLIETFRYAYVNMMQDIGRWLIVGLIVAGLITAFVPESFFALFADNSLLSMVIVLIFAIPMYLCATGSIPIAVALMMKGLSPGTALVLLMAGPAVNVASMLVVGKVLGKRTLLIYIASIVAGAMAFGLGIDYLLPREWFTAPIAHTAECCSEGGSWFNIGCSIVLTLLLLNAMIMRFRHKNGCSGGSCNTEETRRQVTYRIEGLRCNHCKANAEKAILALEGVEKVEIDLATGIAKIDWKQDLEREADTEERIKRDEASMKTAVEALGFKLIIEQE